MYSIYHDLLDFFYHELCPLFSCIISSLRMREGAWVTECPMLPVQIAVYHIYGLNSRQTLPLASQLTRSVSYLSMQRQWFSPSTPASSTNKPD